MEILKNNWKKDFITFYLLAFISGIILYGIHLSYNPLYWLQWAIGVPLVFFIIFWLASRYLYSRLSITIEKFSKGNNISYHQAKANGRLRDLIAVHALYFAIFFVYFYFVFKQSLHLFKSGFEFYLFLFFIGGMAVIFIRTAHYVNPKIGNKIGETIAYFFFPFGILLAGAILYNLTIGKDVIRIFEDLIKHWQILPYFLMLLFITLSLDVIIDTKVKFDKNRKKEKVELRRVQNINEEIYAEYHETLYSINSSHKNYLSKKKTSNKNHITRKRCENIVTIEENIDVIHKNNHDIKSINDK